MFNTLKVLVAVICLLAAAQAQANPKLLSSGGLYADLCVLAFEEPATFQEQLKANGLDEEALICNGEPLPQFLRAKAAMLDVATSTVITAGNDDLYTQVCLKGASGEMEWNEITNVLPREVDAFNVMCNGEPIRAFIRKHRT